MDLDDYFFEEDKLGMKTTSGSVSLKKSENNLIGISIGGGGKYCPCLYVVQVFDHTSAAEDGTLQSGDEIVGVNGINVKGKSKQEAAQLIQKAEGSVTIQYNKLHADPKQGKTLDIAIKKVKHRMVEKMASSTADALGLSRAILCNDSLVKKLEGLERTELVYKTLVERIKKLMKAFCDLINVHRKFGDIFCQIAVRESQSTSNEAFNQFGEAHRQMERYGIDAIKKLKPILSDLGTYLYKAIPDTQLTIKRYADVKFEYLSYCLRIKEMDDEDMAFAQLQEPLYRVETGNYEYRLILRCRQEARSRFARLRNDVMVKLELLDSKHVEYLTDQLKRFIRGLAQYHSDCRALLHGKRWFPIELNLSGSTFQRPQEEVYDYEDDDLLDIVQGSEATENVAKKDDPISDLLPASMSEWGDTPTSNDVNLLDIDTSMGLLQGYESDGSNLPLLTPTNYNNVLGSLGPPSNEGSDVITGDSLLDMNYENDLLGLDLDANAGGSRKVSDAKGDCTVQDLLG